MFSTLVMRNGPSHRGKLVRPLLIHLEHKVSFLKCSAFDVPSVEPTKVLLINSQPNQSHFSLFFQKVYYVLARLLCLSLQIKFHSRRIVIQITR